MFSRSLVLFRATAVPNVMLLLRKGGDLLCRCVAEPTPLYSDRNTLTRPPLPSCFAAPGEVTIAAAALAACELGVWARGVETIAAAALAA